jgi:osmotically-inducible protein OsmY
MHRPGLVRQSPRYLLFACAVVACLGNSCYGPDATVRRRVLQRLSADPATRKLSLDVSVSAGVATVSGGVTQRSQEEQVLVTVRGTEGVLDAINDLTISDDVIATRVRDALKADPLVSTVPVTVSSREGVVRLESNQTNANQRQRMMEIAASVEDVVEVVDAMK